MTYFLLGIIILLLILVILLGFLIRIQLNKIKIYEQWILDIRDDISATLYKMKEIDIKGTFATKVNDKGLFESDDEVGVVFEEMQQMLQNLNEKILE